MKPSEEIIAGARALNAGCSVLSTSDTSRIRATVSAKYARGESGPLWERIHESSGEQDAEVWKRLSQWLPVSSILIFFEEHDDQAMIELSPVRLASAVLGECCLFVFYLTDREGSFLIAFNDHDYVICCGAAQQWMNNTGFAPRDD